ncbi:hypothetical protein BDB01DRAFT_531974 [Pilobolus umbonatus]|nr:hypothetical protein BDB01DRAFT_531974 [Pilobolus umbonatus]
MYSTDKHICFYAALPESQLIENKFGYLLLKKKGSKYERYFFDIKGDILAWYESSADTYSPIGKIDLKYVLTVRQSNKKKFGIKIVSMDKTWYLQADTNAAVIEWTNALQKAVFRAKNKGSSLKIKLPFENILDIEQTEAFEFQRFLKIRAVGIDDSFVVDEYYFAYFNDIEATFNQLIDTWQNYTHHPVQDNSENHSPSHSTDHSPSLSISDLYDADSQPIVIQSANRHAQTSSVVANALSVPAALKDFLYPSHSKTADIQEDSSDSEEEDQRFGWLYDKHRSGMKMVYGLLSGSSGSTAVALDDEDNEEEDGCEHPLSGQYANEAEIVDERTLSNFQKYFVLPESEKLLTVFRCSLLKTLPCYGKLYISTHYISFNSKGFATKAKIIIPFTDVIRIQKIRTKGYIFHSLSIVTHNKKEIFLEFSSITRRNGCFARLFLQHKRVIESQNEPEKIEQ